MDEPHDLQPHRRAEELNFAAVSPAALISMSEIDRARVMLLGNVPFRTSVMIFWHNILDHIITTWT